LLLQGINVGQRGLLIRSPVREAPLTKGRHLISDIRYENLTTYRNRYPQGMRMQQGDYTALATEPVFLWAFLSFRAAFLAARSA